MSDGKSDGNDLGFLERHEFLLRRLHSLSGLVPVGAYMCVHLLTNSLGAFGAAPFQKAVYQIHSLGPVLPFVEWTFIFIPLLFHAIYGIVIVRTGQPNSGAYRYGGNFRYTLQRATGIIAFFFIFAHVFHMHGWIHADWWHNMIAPLGGGMFKPYSASSSAAEAMRINVAVPILYAVGILSCVFHLANGIWTAGITWGVWTTPSAQTRAGYVCTFFGVLLGLVGMQALFAFSVQMDIKKAIAEEKAQFEGRVAVGDVDAKSEKYGPNVHSDSNQESASAEADTKSPSDSAQTAPRGVLNFVGD